MTKANPLPEIVKCPSCGGKCGLCCGSDFTGLGEFYVQCIHPRSTWGCGMRGPFKKTRRGAILAFNDMVRYPR